VRKFVCRIQGAGCVVAMLATVLAAAAIAAEESKPAGKCCGKGVRATVSAQAGGAPARQGFRAAAAQWSIPDYWVLRMPQHEDAIELSDEQKAKLKKIGEDYRDAVQAAYAKMREAKPDQRAELAKAAQAKAAEARTKAKEKVERVLTKEQLAKCEELQFRVQAGGLLRSPQVQEKLELTEKQQERLENIFAKHKELVQKRAERQRKLQQAANEKALKVLTEEQIEKLKQKQLETMSHHTYLLSASHGPKELGLTEKQQSRIKEIGEQWQKNMRELWQGLKDIEAAERAEKMKDIRAKTDEMTAKMRETIRGVLTAEQLEKAKEALFKAYGAMMVRYQTKAGGAIELTDEQREKIDAIFAGVVEKGQGWGAKAQNVYRKATDKALDVLAPEQIEKLKEIRQNWGKQRPQDSQEKG